MNSGAVVEILKRGGGSIRVQAFNPMNNTLPVCEANTGSGSVFTRGYKFEPIQQILQQRVTDERATAVSDPTRSLVTWLLSEEQKDILAALSKADCIALMPDTNRPEKYPYWKSVEVPIQLRERMPAEKWIYFHVPITADTGLNSMHYTLAKVVLLEVMHALFPNKYVILHDLDAAHPCEMKAAYYYALATKALTAVLAHEPPWNGDNKKVMPGVIFISEKCLRINGGLIIAVPDIADASSATYPERGDSLNPDEVVTVVERRRIEIMMGSKVEFSQARLCLVGSPLHRARFDSTSDILAGYSVVALATDHLVFPDKSARKANVSGLNLTRPWLAAVWGGACFEQGIALLLPVVPGYRRAVILGAPELNMSNESASKGGWFVHSYGKAQKVERLQPLEQLTALREVSITLGEDQPWGMNRWLHATTDLRFKLLGTKESWQQKTGTLNILCQGLNGDGSTTEQETDIVLANNGGTLRRYGCTPCPPDEYFQESQTWEGTNGMCPTLHCWAELFATERFKKAVIAVMDAMNSGCIGERTRAINKMQMDSGLARRVPAHTFGPGTDATSGLLLMLTTASAEPDIALQNLLSDNKVKVPILPRSVVIKGHSAGSYNAHMIYHLIAMFGDQIGLVNNLMIASALAMPASMIPTETRANIIYVHAQQDQLCRINDIEDLTELPDHIKVIVLTPGDESTTQQVLGGRSHNYEFILFQMDFLLSSQQRLIINVNRLQEVAYTMLPCDYYTGTLVAGLAILANKDFENLIKKITECTRALRDDLQNPTPETSYHILAKVSVVIKEQYTNKLALGNSVKLDRAGEIVAGALTFLARNAHPQILSWVLSYAFGGLTERQERLRQEKVIEGCSGFLHVLQSLDPSSAVVRVTSVTGCNGRKDWAVWSDDSDEFRSRGLNYGDVVVASLVRPGENFRTLRVALSIKERTTNKLKKNPTKEERQQNRAEVYAFSAYMVLLDDQASDLAPLLEEISLHGRMVLIDWNRSRTVDSLYLCLKCLNLPPSRIAALYGRHGDALQCISTANDKGTNITRMLLQLEQEQQKFKALNGSEVPEDKEAFGEVGEGWDKLARHTTMKVLEFYWKAISNPNKNPIILLLIQIAVAMCRGKSTTYVQGVTGSGKTFASAMITVFLVELCDVRILWTGEMRTPQVEGVQELQQNLSEEVINSKKRYIRLPSKQEDGMGALDVAFHDRQNHFPTSSKHSWENWEEVRCILITTGSYSATVTQPYSQITNVIKHMKPDIVLTDEAQTYGQPADGVLMSQIGPRPLLILLGDRQQPVGGKNTEAAFDVGTLDELVTFSAGIRREELSFATPEAFLEKLGKAADTAFDEPKSSTTILSSLSDVHKLVAKLKWLPKSDTAGKAAGIDTEMFPNMILEESIRICDIMYAFLAWIGYSSLADLNRGTKITGKLSDVEAHAGGKRALLSDRRAPSHTDWVQIVQLGKRDSTLNDLAYGHIAWDRECGPEYWNLTRQEDKGRKGLADMLGKNAAHRVQVDTTNLTVGMSFVLTQRSKSIQASSEKVLSNFPYFKDTVYATICEIIYRSPSNLSKGQIGIFAAWKNLVTAWRNELCGTRFEDKAHRTTATELQPALISKYNEKHGLAGKDAALSIHDIAFADLMALLKTHGKCFANFFTIDTFVSAASKTVAHSLVLIPKHTKFTNMAPQFLVAATRATGVTFFLAPAAPQATFFSTLLITFLFNTNCDVTWAKYEELHNEGLEGSRQGCSQACIPRWWGIGRQFNCPPYGIKVRFKLKGSDYTHSFPTTVVPRESRYQRPFWWEFSRRNVQYLDLIYVPPYCYGYRNIMLGMAFYKHDWYLVIRVDGVIVARLRCEPPGKGHAFNIEDKTPMDVPPESNLQYLDVQAIQEEEFIQLRKGIGTVNHPETPGTPDPEDYVSDALKLICNMRNQGYEDNDNYQDGALQSHEDQEDDDEHPGQLTAEDAEVFFNTEEWKSFNNRMEAYNQTPNPQAAKAVEMLEDFLRKLTEGAKTSKEDNKSKSSRKDKQMIAGLGGDWSHHCDNCQQEPLARQVSKCIDDALRDYVEYKTNLLPQIAPGSITIRLKTFFRHMHCTIQRIHIDAWIRTGILQGDDKQVQEAVCAYAAALAEVIAKYLSHIALPEGITEWDDVNRRHLGDTNFWTKQILMSWEAEANAIAAGGKLRLSNEAADKDEQDTAMPKELHIKFLATNGAIDQERKCGSAILFLPQSIIAKLIASASDYRKARLQEEAKGDTSNIHVVFPTEASIAFGSNTPRSNGVVARRKTVDNLCTTHESVKQLLGRCNHVYEHMHKYFAPSPTTIELEIEASLPVARDKPRNTGCQDQLATDYFARVDYNQQQQAGHNTVKAATSWLGHPTIKDEGTGRIWGDTLRELMQTNLSLEEWVKAKNKCNLLANRIDKKNDKKRHHGN